MRVQSRSLENKIIPLVSSLVGGDANTREINRFVSICHRMATRYITMKTNKPSWHQHIQTENINDLAWDSIAEIFRKDDEGQFTCLIDYYKPYDLNAVTEGELYSATRRLVFSKVNDNLFRLMRDYDPSLSKIIRNIKLAVNDCPNIQSVRKWNTPFLIFSDSPVKRTVTGWMPPEILQARLTPMLTAKESLPEILQKIREIICSQTEYVHAYPLVPLSMLIREAHVNIQDSAEMTVEPSTALLQDDVSRVISSSITYLKSGMRSHYVKTGKIDEQTFENYFAGIRDYYIDSYVFYLEGIPYFTYIKRYLPELTYSIYRSYHRKYVEYLMRVSKSHIHQQLEKVI